MADPAPFFIVGSARSGTTLLRLMFNAHPAVAVPPESRFIVELRPDGSEVQVAEFLSRLEAHRRFAMWKLPIGSVAAEIGERSRIDYHEAIAATYRAYAANQEKALWGDKTPRYIEHIPFLATLFPEARFIHMIRDGRNVALSYADVPFGPKTVGRAAELWRRRVEMGLRDGRSLGDERYIEVRYEDLVADISMASRRLCEFLGLDFDADMMDYTSKARSDVMPWAGSRNPHVSKPPQTNTRSWQEQMSDRQVAVFEALAGSLLEALDYERRYPVARPADRALGRLSRMGLPIGRLRGSRTSGR